MALHPYYQAAIEVLRRIEETQASVMDAAAQAVFLSLKEGGVLNVFATGHSSLVAQEAFHRAGGLVPVNPILEPFLSPLISPRKSGGLEKIAEIAAVLMDYQDGGQLSLHVCRPTQVPTHLPGTLWRRIFKRLGL